MSEARIVDTSVPSDPKGLVLVLHGGAARQRSMRVSPAQLSVLRMVPIAARIAHLAPDELIVQRLLNSRRGWDSHHTPVADVKWALAQAAERFGGRLPTCLVGHSLGGRAALLAATDPAVHSAVALAPWVYPDEGRIDLAGRPVLIVHGDADRIASPSRSAAVARDLARTARVAYLTVDGGKHAMLCRHSTFDGVAADFVVATLLGREPSPLVARALAGEQRLDA